MKSKIQLILLTGFVFTLCSCVFILDGRWSDNIKLSTKSVEFSSLSDSVTIKTGGSGWWISNVNVNGVNFYDSIPNHNLDEKVTIKQDCFVVERRDYHTLFIQLNENLLPVQRIVVVELEKGDYFDRVKITQKPK